MDFRETIRAALADAEDRPQQVELAARIDAAFAAGRHCLAEAGTGVGKTMAYLVPLIERLGDGDRGVVSTFTLNLQAQLAENDLPRVLEAMGRGGLEWAILKGRSNYLCLRRLNSERELWGESDPSLADIWEWSARTRTGDRAEAWFKPRNWAAVASERESCRRQACPWHRQCFFFKARRRAAEVDLLIVNHSLLLTDLARRMREGESDILPEFEMAVIDEAHHLEETAVRALSVRASLLEGRSLLARLARLPGGTLPGGVVEAGEMLLSRIYQPFVAFDGRESFFFSDLPADPGEALGDDLVELGIQLDELSRSSSVLPAGATREHMETACLALQDYLDRLTTILGAEDGPEFRWGENGREEESRDCAVYLSPLRVSEMLREHLFEAVRSVVLTSATLSALGSFAFIRDAVGLTDRVEEVIAGSPFDFGRQAVLYLNPVLDPSSGAPGYYDALAAEIELLTDISRGRAFILFTSYRALDAVHSRLAPSFAWPLLRQGTLSNERLIDLFRETPGACLLGTHAFWEGVDIPGDDLACVIIDRLPFSSPDDPLHRARVEAIKAEGGNWFMEYALPLAQIRLRQGLGRLIRTRNDRGVMAVLDSRLLRKRYGSHIMDGLPACPQVVKLEDLRRASEELFGVEAGLDGR